MLTIDEIKLMFEKAKEARNNSYSPYSKFKVGACVLLNNGETILGTNIENASYGLTSCAERNALFATYSLGYSKKDIKGLFIIGDTEGPCSPCGACRQVISELIDEDTPIVLSNLEFNHVVKKVSDLLPFSFSKGDLNV